MRILIALPVLNEEKVLRASVEAVHRFVAAGLPGHETTIVIADNGSTDGTEAIGRELEQELPGVRYLRLSGRGKGLAIREAWKSGDADIYVFMDADLATDLAALPELVRRIEQGAELAVGSRFHPDSVVDRSAFRKALSRGYRTLLGTALGTAVSDVPCGFKAASSRLVRDVMPCVRDDQWFFDTELVVRAERAGHRIDEVPVAWRELKPAGRASKVKVLPLAKEYARKVFRLRRELGAAPETGRAGGITALLARISRAEWRFAFGLAAAVAIVTSVPPVVAALAARSAGIEFTGRQFLSPGDFGVYLSYIAQAKAGHLLFENLTTSERLTPVLNILWLSIGWLAKGLSLSPLAAYHIARIALIFPLAAVAYAACSYFFAERMHRRWAYLLFMLGSGLGLYVAPFLSQAAVMGGRYEWPIDFWVAEANGFMTMLYSPHFIASWTLIIAALTLLLMAYDTGRAKYGVWAGLTALVLFQFHPFHVPTLYAVGGVALLARTRSRGFRMSQWTAYLAFLALSAPSLAYHYWLTHWSPNAAFMLDNNITVTPSLFHLVVGFGAISALAIGGWVADKEEGLLAPEHRRFLAIWALVQLVLVYAPFPFQRRLLQGLEFPLVMLSVPAISALQKALRRKTWYDGAFALTYGTFLAAAVFLPSSVSAIARSLEAYGQRPPSMFFFDADQSAALAWLRQNTGEDAVILSSMGSGNDISGWAVRRVYLGHWANTIDLAGKQAETTRFFGSMTSAERSAFAAAQGITHVYEGPAERKSGGSLDGDPAFSAVFRSGGIAIYALR